MKKFYSLFLVLCISCIGTIYAQDVITLGTTDNIATILSSYTGSNLVLVIPSGYTNPQGSTAIALPTSLAAGIKITLRGDGSMPNLSTLSFTANGLNLSAFKFKDLTLTGTSTSSYLLNVGDGIAFNVDTLSFENCNISTVRCLIRFQNTGTTVTQNAGYISINNCKIYNNLDYGMVYNNKVGGFMGPIVAKNSTFYGMNSIFACSANATSASISDCTFDNLSVAAGKYLVDFNALNVPLTITNCIFGKSLVTTGSLLRTGGLLTITNSYATSDSPAGAVVGTLGITGSLTVLTDASAALFKAPNTSTAGTSFVNTADYSIIDAAFAGKNIAGDPRWYNTPTAVISPEASSTVISYNGTEIILNAAQDIAIYTITGELLKSAKNVNQLSVANLPKGVYVVKAGSAVQKFVNR
jgi:hypothetical protein